MHLRTDVAIVGAGPYGLSLAAHLRGGGADFRIFGRPMDAWLNHMPKGMLLKSDGFASNLYDPGGEYPLARFCRERGFPYDDERIPVRLDTFVEYGLAFSRRFVPELRETHIVSLARAPGGFSLKCEDGEVVSARRVVVAAGIGQFRFLPAALSGLDPKYVSHSYEHHDVAVFSGRRVAVIGAGASAIDLAGLMRDQGCDVQLICRADVLKFGSAPSNRSRSSWQRLRHPSSGLGPGWRSRLSTDAPLLFHALPAALRLPIVRRHLGPAASWRMREKIAGRVPVLSGYDVVDAAADGDRIKLSLRTRGGTDSVVFFDHVIAATGYHVDIDRLDFIDGTLRSEITCVDQAPVLTTRFESSAKGLFFVGPVAANSFGPLMRFAFGARFASRRVLGALRSRENASALEGEAPAALAP
jgi:Pyridine nucleotide-disulphide oxidoreductase